MTVTSTTDVGEFAEAVAWHQQRKPMTRGEWDDLSASQRQRAFVVSGVAQARLVEDVHNSLQRAIASGKPFEEWKKEQGPALEKAWGGSVKDPGFRLETIYRNAAQTAYSAGRWKQIHHPAVRKARPFLQFDAILDGAVTPICRTCNGTLLPIDDPWWDSRVPPLHHRCRSGTVTLDKFEVAELGGVTQAPDVDADGSWGQAPDDGSPGALVDPATFPESLRPEVERVVQKAQTQAATPPPVPMSDPAYASPSEFGADLAGKLSQNDARGIRTAMRRWLAADGGQRSFDVSSNRPEANVFLFRPSSEMEGADGLHRSTGSIRILDKHRSLAIAGAQRLADGKELFPSHVNALRVMIHEESHGFSPKGPNVYRGAGIVIEEVGTELIARRAMRRLGVTIDADAPSFTRGVFDEGAGHYGHYMGQFFRALAKAGVPEKGMAERVENAFLDFRANPPSELIRNASQYAAEIAARLGDDLTDEQREAARKAMAVLVK